MWRLVVLSGCLAAGGPTVAVRTDHHVAFGWDADAMVGPLGVSGGQSLSSDANAWYVGARGARFRSRYGGDDMYFASQRGVALTGLVGIGGAEQGVTPAVSLAPMAYAVSNGSCSQGTHAWFSAEIGVRWVGAFEVYAAPKVGGYAVPCL